MRSGWRRVFAGGTAALAAGALLDRAFGWRWRAGAASALIHSQVQIAAAPDVVWEELADISAQPRWMRDLKEIRFVSPGPIGVGHRLEGRVRIFGVTAPDPVEITVWDPPRRYAIRHLGPFRGRGEFTLEPAPEDTTVVTWDELLVAPLFPNLAGLVLRPLFGRIFRADLERFRELLEARPPKARS